MIYIVTGFMRSGTSMMMQAMEAGGMPIAYEKSRDAINEKGNGQHRPNPESLFEFSLDTMQKPRFPRQCAGGCIKVVTPYLRFLSVHKYKVVYMLRDPYEIQQSYRRAFGEELPLELITCWQDEGLRLLRNRRDVSQIVCLNFVDVIKNPLLELSKLHWPVDVQAAAATVKNDLYRIRMGLD